METQQAERSQNRRYGRPPDWNRRRVVFSRQPQSQTYAIESFRPAQFNYFDASRITVNQTKHTLNKIIQVNRRELNVLISP